MQLLVHKNFYVVLAARMLSARQNKRVMMSEERRICKFMPCREPSFSFHTTGFRSFGAFAKRLLPARKWTHQRLPATHQASSLTCGNFGQFSKIDSVANTQIAVQ